MKLMKCFFCIFLFGLSCPVWGDAQELTDTARLTQEILAMRGDYQGKSMSFDLHYSYASELKPGVVLDSLEGNMACYNGAFRYKLDNMETITSAGFSIMIFNEEKMIYVAQSRGSKAPDPTESIMGMLRSARMRNFSVTENGKEKRLIVRFESDAPCREMLLVQDKKTHLLQSVQYILKTELLMQSRPGVSGAKPDAAYGPYAIVQTSYDHYKSLTQAPDWIDMGHFFYKDGAEMKMAPAYKDFKIFNGSPNL